jgi:ParB-like chromosome segregation protein Spo0J
MPDKRTTPGKEHRRVAELVDHPLQSAYTGTTTEHDDEDLQESIEEHGLKDPIGILPKNKAGLRVNTIMDGHRRRDALVSLGEESTAVIVRYDLATASRETVDQEFLRANMDRRQLDPVARAYIAAKLIAIENKRSLNELMSGYMAGEVRERVGKLVGIGGRHLSRLLRVIRTPLEVQTSVRRKKLSIVLAEKVADIPDDVQAEIADRIRAGEDAKQVVESFVGKTCRKPTRSVTEFSHYMKSLKNVLECLSDSVDEIGFSATPEELEMLKAGQKLHRELIRRLRKTASGEAKSWNRAVGALT